MTNKMQRKLTLVMKTRPRETKQMSEEEEET